MPYHNSNNLKGSQLDKPVKKALTQQEKILKIIRRDHHRTLTARRVWYIFKSEHGHIQLNSVRRSITNLIQADKLAYVMDGSEHRFLKHTCPVEGFETTERIVTNIS